MKDNLLSNGYSLADKVFKKLEEEILNGALKAGENLTELRISARLGVSRTPVREAIHRLEQEGLVQLTPNKGAVVVGVSEKDLRDIYDIRMKLEGLASRWAAEQITEEDAKSLRDILELQEFYTAKGDLDQLRNLDSQFHERNQRQPYPASNLKQSAPFHSTLSKNVFCYKRTRTKGDGGTSAHRRCHCCSQPG